MEYLQYAIGVFASVHVHGGFKPCYKWNTFNTCNMTIDYKIGKQDSFKPCYKWNTFNTFIWYSCLGCFNSVLNLVISGIPSIPGCQNVEISFSKVLNLVISGIPSILLM